MTLIHAGDTSSLGICDLAFMVDTSSSIKGEVNFQLVKKFVTKVFHLFSRGGDVRYGLVVFGNKAEVNIFDFTIDSLC